VIIKADALQIAVIRTSTMTGDTSKPMSGATAPAADLIQSLDATGFTVGRDARVNASGTTYHWIAFKAGAGVLRVGSYAGNGGSQSITGLGFSPEYAITLSGGAHRAIQRFSGMTSSFRFDSATGTAGGINSLDADGFSVGNANEANRSGTTYHYVAFNAVAGSIDVASYSGTGGDDRNIAGVGFQPHYLAIRANDTATARPGQHRPASLGGSSSLFYAAVATTTNGIQALQSDGFQVGTDAAVNTSGVTYHYAAFKNAP
jgi:hypothetical protein